MLGAFLEGFCKVDDLRTKAVKLPGQGVQFVKLTVQTPLGKVGVDRLNDLVVVVSDADELVVKTAQAAVIIVRGVVDFDYAKLSIEQLGKDKTGGLPVHSGLVHHLQKAGVLLVVELEIIAVGFRAEGSGMACFFV